MRLIIVLVAVLFASCAEINTTNANDTYKYWSGSAPPSDVELLSGQYWQSGHWTKEYVMFLKFKPTDQWWIEFLKQNSISSDPDDWEAPNKAPTWFKPSNRSVRYRPSSTSSQGSRYFRDSTTGICYFYEIQL